ncbi:DUF2797 domain-containing protein [Aliikangiella coralliicola]|uniref:DUF2797 domain-containing protein n=1 Tax=Aliikangiella coralliicola TaxID=2592383 RepID=A0A545UJN0_9GAMM|nr:DUF2797 domain-containing protein [Aliikangiella coralliicola]TQV89674.1 DUF2797 domain-containing protein [Aliikangiella coralliicola]
MGSKFDMLTGVLAKMRADLGDHENKVNYRLPVGEEELPLNQFLGQSLKLEFSGKISCLHCGRATKKSFSQGYCYPCMKKLAQCDMCIMKPETCHYHEGTCREPEWGERNCFTPHYVYLSNTSGLKVGITRHTQIPTRWIDQGATQASIIFKVNTRQQSGFVETAFKDLIADKTNWRALLKGNAEPRDILGEAEKLKSQLKEGIDSLITRFGEDEIEPVESELVEIDYPVLEFPSKITSHNFDKNPVVEGTLKGIKGQYLIFDTGVINIRKFTSYEVSVSY